MLRNEKQYCLGRKTIYGNDKISIKFINQIRKNLWISKIFLYIL